MLVYTFRRRECRLSNNSGGWTPSWNGKHSGSRRNRSMITDRKAAFPVASTASRVTPSTNFRIFQRHQIYRQLMSGVGAAQLEAVRPCCILPPPPQVRYVYYLSLIICAHVYTFISRLLFCLFGGGLQQQNVQFVVGDVCVEAGHRRDQPGCQRAAGCEPL